MHPLHISSVGKTVHKIRAMLISSRGLDCLPIAIGAWKMVLPCCIKALSARASIRGGAQSWEISVQRGSSNGSS